MEGDRTCLKMCMDRILPTTKAVELKSGNDKGNVIINIGGLEDKVIEAHQEKELEYDEGVVIEDAQVEAKVKELESES